MAAWWVLLARGDTAEGVPTTTLLFQGAFHKTPQRRAGLTFLSSSSFFRRADKGLRWKWSPQSSRRGPPRSGVDGHGLTVDA